MKYNIMPVVGGESSSFPLLPSSMGREEVVAALSARLHAMEIQGYWRDDRGRQVPLEDVAYQIYVEQEEDDASARPPDPCGT